MKLKLFAVRDVKAETFHAPMAVATEGLARRAFVEGCTDKRSPLSQYPSDFMLYEIGSYEPNDGRVEGIVPVPRLIMTATEAIAQAKAERAVLEPELPGVAEVVTNAR